MVCDPSDAKPFGSRRLIAWSRALPEIRRKLGFLESDFEDLVAVDA
jgi:hypothetical protein